MDQEKIGKFIAKIRKEKNITQKELAEKLGVTDRAISKWENGRGMPDYSLIKSLCNELEITPNDLLSGEKLKDNNYENKTNENIENILKEYYKMKKQRKLAKNILIVIIILFATYVIRTLFLFGIISLSFLNPNIEITGIDNYNKSYYIDKYGGDIDSNLSIFPDDTSKMINPKFSSSLGTNLFDSEGYILLNTKYTEENFDNEIKRLSTLEISISNCKGKVHTNYVIYDNNSYKYTAYITIDGFDSTYEYALIDKDNLSINYIYLSYPNVNNSNYKEYLKNNKNEYLEVNTLDKYSMYNHSFDNGQSWNEFGDCK